KRRVCVAVFGLGGIGLAFWLLQERSPIDRTTYDAIALGMPENEAVALVPIAPHVQTVTRQAQLLAEAGTTQFRDEGVVVKTLEDRGFLYLDAKTKNEMGKMRAWQTDEYSLQVLFSLDGKVIGKQLFRSLDTNESWWDALRRFLKS